MADDSEARPFIGLKDLTDAGKLATKRKAIETLRYDRMREYSLNRAFYEGRQWVYYSPTTRRVLDMPENAGPAWRVRLYSNQIAPGVAHWAAQTTKTRPTIEAEPDSGSDFDVKSAQMAESLFEYAFEEWGLQSKTVDAMHDAALSGGFMKVSWDALAGKPMTFTLDPNGQPIMDEELAELYKEQISTLAQQQGQDPEAVLAQFVKTVYVGDISIENMTAENVLIDPSAKRFEDANWAICTHYLDPDEIKARWGVTVSPNSIRDTERPQIGEQRDRQQENTLREVYIMYVRPCPALPKGRYVAWIEGPNQILQDIDWPYPFRILPLVKFPGRYRPGSAYDDPITSEARGMQKDLNRTLSQVVEHKNLTMRPQVFAPTGSLKQKITAEPGAVWEYNPIGNHVPQWREIPGLPGYVFEHLADLQNRIDKVYNRIPTGRDQLPARVDSGQIVEQIQESTADNLSPVILGLEDAMARLGTLIVAYAKEYYTEPRLLKIRGQGGSVQVKKFMGSDIEGGFSFKPRYGTGLPRSRAGRQAAIMELLQAQLIDPRTAMKHLDLGDVNGVQALIALDEDHAYRDHDKILRGIPINAPALQEAQQQMQQFMQQAQQVVAQIQAGQPVDYDQDGQPDDPNQVMQQLQQQQQQLQQAMEDAPWQPRDFENVQEHIEIHSRMMKSVEFEGYPPEVQAIFEKHYQLTYQRNIEIMMASPDQQATPKINVRAMGTVSAPVMAKLLQKGGIDVTEDDVSQPPLDTQVIDTLEQPNVDESGNSHLQQMDQVLTMQQASDDHALNQAKVAQAMGHAEASASHASDQTQLQQEGILQQQVMTAQKHAQSLRHAEEKHKQALANAEKAASAKPPGPKSKG